MGWIGCIVIFMILLVISGCSNNDADDFYHFKGVEGKK